MFIKGTQLGQCYLKWGAGAALEDGGEEGRRNSPGLFLIPGNRGCGGNHNTELGWHEKWLSSDWMRPSPPPPPHSPPAPAAGHGTHPAPWRLQSGLELLERIIYKELDYYTQLRCKPATRAHFNQSWWVSKPFPFLTFSVTKPKSSSRVVPVSLRTRMSLSRGILRLYARCQSVDLRTQHVWGRLLCGKRKTRYRPNICLSLSVKSDLAADWWSRPTSPQFPDRHTNRRAAPFYKLYPDLQNIFICIYNLS